MRYALDAIHKTYTREDTYLFHSFERYICLLLYMLRGERAEKENAVSALLSENKDKREESVKVIWDTLFKAHILLQKR